MTPSRAEIQRRISALLFDVGSPGRYALVGLGNTAVGFSGIALATMAGIAVVPANMLGYVGGLAFAYLGGRAFTFAGRNRAGSLPRHIVSFLAAYGLNLTAVLGTIRGGVPELGAQAAGTVVYAVAFYLLSRFWVFPAAVSPSSGRRTHTA